MEDMEEDTAVTEAACTEEVGCTEAACTEVVECTEVACTEEGTEAWAWA